jgi:MFS superfamily sulfate permease-like transporter
LINICPEKVVIISKFLNQLPYGTQSSNGVVIMGCCCGHHGWKKLVVGVLMLLNLWVWPQWLGIDGWLKFFAVLLVIGGIIKVLMPCNCTCNVEDKPKKKR